MQNEKIRAIQQKVGKLAEDAYRAGIDGDAGYPMDVDGEMAGFERFVGRKLKPISFRAITHIIIICNQAFERGCRGRVTYAADNIWMNGEG